MPLSYFSDWESGERRDVSVESVRLSEGWEASMADLRERSALMAFVERDVRWMESEVVLRGQLRVRQDCNLTWTYPGESYESASFKTRLSKLSRNGE